jgi:hypothetical protein
MSAYDPKRNMAPRDCSHSVRFPKLRRVSTIGRAARKEVVRKEVVRKEAVRKEVAVHTVVLMPATAVVLWASACVRGQQWVAAEETLLWASAYLRGQHWVVAQETPG